MVRLADLFRRRRRKKRPVEGGPFAPATFEDAGRKLRGLTEAPSILVLKLDHIGDLITALPACERLRAAFPASRLDLLCGPYNVELARSTGLFDAVHAYDFFGAQDRTPRRADADDVDEMRRLGLPAYDIAVDLRHDDDTRILLWGIAAQVRVGFASLSRPFALDIALPEMEASARASGLLSPVDATTRLVLLAEALSSLFRAARHGYGGALGCMPPPATAPARFPHGYVVLAVGSRLPIKRWPVPAWQELAQALLARTPFGLVLLGRAGEDAGLATLADTLPGNRMLDLTGGLTLAEVPAVLREAKALVGLDSGPAHMASALGVPCVVLFSGFAEARVWAPIGPATEVLRAQTACAPCFLPSADLCPFERRCMTALQPDDVLAALARVGRHPALAALARPEGAGLAFAEELAQETPALARCPASGRL
ncbi:glycosyltransferase family 9 protein [Xanthobacter dioxanivorans]|uniref:Glycosyltransferase family 9 protein n=1 Tax=Xanthobacter dioxanivorans TaxID=2528964 RepID=A0A974PM87_9HYPH|nr:glycosyltransferase family 9 protein [Xanthobacter dioxanivorans]QRG06177.1 glycosyltransferase family 9 protein [Xanthobacter dioxanivorans]